MFLFRTSGLADSEQIKSECTRSMLGSPRLRENASDIETAATAPVPMATENGFQQGEFIWPEASEAGATLRAPSFANVGAREGDGGSMLREGRTREQSEELSGDDQGFKVPTGCVRGGAVYLR